MTEPRYLIMAKPTGLVSDNLQARLEGLGLVGTLGPGEVDRSNWHQSLSDRYWPSEIPDLEAKLTRALAVLVAYRAALSLNRIVREGGRCRVEADGTKDFRALLLAIKKALASQGLLSPASNEPHVSLSYWGAQDGPIIHVTPIEWVIDRVVAVEGWREGRRYRYREVAGINLRPYHRQRNSKFCFDCEPHQPSPDRSGRNAPEIEAAILGARQNQIDGIDLGHPKQNAPASFDTGAVA